MSQAQNNGLSFDEKVRYGRHIALPEMGFDGQLRLKRAKVLVVGAGGLGSPALMYLAAAGVGTIGIIDGDIVDSSNLQRQIIHTTTNIGRNKALSAKNALLAINPHIKVNTVTAFLDNDNAEQEFADYDIIIDATDSPNAKFLINDTCVKLGKSLCLGALSQYEGHTMTITPGCACYRCVFDSHSSLDKHTGPLSPVPGILGTILATEAIKLITGIGQPLTNSLLSVNCLTMQFNSFIVKPAPNCLCHHGQITKI